MAGDDFGAGGFVDDMGGIGGGFEDDIGGGDDEENGGFQSGRSPARSRSGGESGDDSDEDEDEEPATSRRGRRPAGKSTGGSSGAKRGRRKKKSTVAMPKRRTKKAAPRSKAKASSSSSSASQSKPKKRKQKGRSGPAAPSDGEQSSDESEDEDEDREEEVGRGDEDEEEDEGRFLSPGGTDSRRVRKSITGYSAAPGGSAGPPLRMDDSDDDESGGPRRSKRRRWKVLDHWKGERVRLHETTLENGQRVQEAVVAERLGAVTPKQKPRAGNKRKRGKSAASGRASKKARSGDGQDVEPMTDAAREALREVRSRTMVENVLMPKKLDSRSLRGVRESNDETQLPLPPSNGAPATTTHVVHRAAKMQFERLQAEGEAADEDDEVAMAAAAFDTSQFISGTVRLEPTARKDTEQTQGVVQLFSVQICQPKSLLVHIGTEAFLMHPGDQFLVPPNVPYSIRNLSQSTTARVTFVVLKPVQESGGIPSPSAGDADGDETETSQVGS